jgi:hypothetical protein
MFAMKHCQKCARVLPLSQFSIRSKTTKRPCSYCKECQRAYNREHYAANKTRHNRRRYVNQLRYKEQNRERMSQYLADKKCADCGETDPIVLDFDHVRGQKDWNIGDLMKSGFSWRRIEVEIEKCETRCSNCHRRKTAREFKWSKLKFGT